MADLESFHLSMFRKGMASLIAVAVVISASPDTSCAQLSPGRLAFGPSVAWVKPVGDLGAIIPAAFAIGANLDYQAHNAVGFGFDLMYYDESFTASDESSDISSLLEGMRILQSTGQIRWTVNPELRTVPFLDAGAGLYLGLKKLGEDSDHETSLRFGINIGGGVEFFATRSANVSVDLKYHLILDGGEYGSFSYGPSQFFSIGAVMLFNRR